MSPIVAGVQIAQSNGHSCTLGYNAHVGWAYGPPDNNHYFITNSHCTTNGGAADGTLTYVRFAQPDYVNGIEIGVEVGDPPLGDSNSPGAMGTRCRPGRRCRESDAALILYNDPTLDLYGGIARTNGYDLNIARVDQVYTWDYSTVGLRVYKVGARTGETSGSVTATCVDVTQYLQDPTTGNVIDSGVDMLCQSQATYGSDAGDSGSPVFSMPPLGPGRVDAVGLNWGSDPIGNFGDPAYGFRSTFSEIGIVMNELAITLQPTNGQSFGDVNVIRQ